ncbi:unnamed protein product [Closterium sp. NIES-54]
MVQQVLQRFGFTYFLPQSSPLPTDHSLLAPPLDESVEPIGPYPELVGCLMYLMTCTRPDLAYPLSILARYVTPGRHRKEHMDAAKRVFRYLCSTSGMGLVLGRRAQVVLTGHADASWVDDLATQRSSQGYTFSLGSGSVSWRSTRSSSVLSSSCEAEIYAGAMAAQELRWLTYLLTDLGEAPRSPPVLYVDNKAMLALCQEHRLEHGTKHIALHYFLARELQQRGQLRLAYVATRANTADIFTKALRPCDVFTVLLGLLYITLHVNWPCGHLIVLRTCGDIVIHPELALPFLNGLAPAPPIDPSLARFVDGSSGSRSGGGGGRTSNSCRAVRWGVYGGGQVQLQRRPRESLPPHQLHEWYASRSGGDGSSGSCCASVQLGVYGGGLAQRQRRPCETIMPQQLCEWYAQRGASRSSARCPFVIRTGDRAGHICKTIGHTQSRCFSCLSDSWRAEFGDVAELPHWLELFRQGVDNLALDYDAILTAMYALPIGTKSDCSLCVLHDPGIEAAALGATESVIPGLHLPSFTTNLVSTTALQDTMVTITTLGGQRVSICTCTQMGRHLATFTRRLGSSLYTLATRPPQVAASAQVSTSGQVAPPCSCRLLSHQTLLWHHRLGHPSLPRLRGMHSHLLLMVYPGLCLPSRPRLPRPSFFVSRGGSAPLLTLPCFPDDYSPADSPQGLNLLLRERFHQDLSVLSLPSDRGVMEVARTSMIHAAAPHFLWPFAVRYAAHQLNLWPRVSLPETSPTLRWTREVGDASMLRDATFDESVPFYCLFPYRSVPPLPLPLFLSPGSPPVDPLPPQGLALSGVSQVDPLPGAVPVEVAGDSGAARGAESGDVGPGGAEPRGGAEPEGVEPGGAESEGAESGGVEPRGAASSGGPAGPLPRLSPRPEPPSPQQLREWLVRHARLRSGAVGARATGDTRARGAGVTAGAGGTGGAAAAGLGGARTRGTGAVETGGVGVVKLETLLSLELVELELEALARKALELEELELLTLELEVQELGVQVVMVLKAQCGCDRTLFPCFSRFLVSRLLLALLLPYCVHRITNRSRRYSQHPHLGSPVYYFQTISPTPKMTTIRVLLHVASQRDYELHSLDFSTAFLQGSLHEEIWMRRPPRFTGSFPAGTQWSLRRPVYGLPQAPREWHDTLRTTLAAVGFTPSTADPSLFLRTDTSLPPFYVLVYVDNLVFAVAGIEGWYLMTCTPPDLAYHLILLARYVAPGRHRKVDDLATQRSSQGYTFSLGNGSVSWRSTRSSSVLSSSSEAEIYARAMAAHELRWLTYLLTDLGEAPRSPPVLYVDNKVMLGLCHEHKLEHRTKHIALRYFLARELQQRGQLRLAYVASQANTADVFTKALQPCDHQRFNTVFGLVPTLNLWPRVSLPETLPTLRCTGKVGDASVFRVWGSHAFVRDTSADKLPNRTIPCDVTFDESVPFYRLFPYRSFPPPPMPLFLAPGAPPVNPLLPQGPAPLGVFQVDPLPGTSPFQVAIGASAALGAASGGTTSGGAELGGAESEGAETGGAELSEAWGFEAWGSASWGSASWFSS